MRILSHGVCISNRYMRFTYLIIRSIHVCILTLYSVAYLIIFSIRIRILLLYDAYVTYHTEYTNKCTYLIIRSIRTLSVYDVYVSYHTEKTCTYHNIIWSVTYDFSHDIASCSVTS